MIQPRTQRMSVTSEGSRRTADIMNALDAMNLAKPAWMHNPRRHCNGYPTDLFFGSDRALLICEGCPVQQQCLDYALDHGEEHGIWGGMSERSRRRVRRVISRAMRE